MKPKPNILRVPLIAILLSTTVTLLLLSALAETFTEGKQVPPTTEKLNRRLCLGAGARAGGAGADRREQARANRLRVSQRHPHRAQQREHGTARPPDAGWRLRYSRKGKGSRLHHLQGRGDAMDGAVDLERDRACTRAICRVTRIRTAVCVCRWSFPSSSYTVTTKGGTVIIADATSAPRETVHPGMIFSQATPPAADASLGQGPILVDAREIRPRAGNDPLQLCRQAGLCVSQRRRDRPRALRAQRPRDARL